MNLRWLLFDYVDPALALDRSERRAVRSRAFWMMQNGEKFERFLPRDRSARRRYVIANIIAVFLPSLSALAVMIAYFRWLPAGPVTVWIWLQLPLLLAVQTGLWYIAFASVGRIVWRGAVIKALQERGYDVCYECGYFLRGLDATILKCPECGAVRERPAQRTESHAEKQS